ncbi:MAG: tetratricopeptide repeat protein [Hyphomicrobiaceae bacterium]
MTFIVTWALMELSELRTVSPETMLKIGSSSNDRSWLEKFANLKYVVQGQIAQRDAALIFSHSVRDLEAGTEWSLSTAEIPLGRLHDIHHSVVPEIIRHVAPDLHEILIERARNRRPDNQKAQELMLNALIAIQSMRPEALDYAESLLVQAQKIDPHYATAIALHARVHSLRIGQGWAPDHDLSAREALRLARKAIQKDPNNAIALSINGHMLAFLFNELEKATSLFEQAMKVGPNEPLVWLMSAITLAYQGRGKEALERAQFGLRLSPRDPLSLLHYSIAGFCAYAAGEYDLAASLTRHAYAEGKAYSATIRTLACIYAAQGDVARARHYGQELLSVQPDFPDCYERLIRIQEPTFRQLSIQHLRTAGIIPPQVSKPLAAE